MLAEPQYFAICRDCVGEDTPAATCWKCRGHVMYRADASSADFVFGLVHQGDHFGFGMEPTDQFRSWLAEVTTE
jgi:hypothetical protein